ncbi:hypothetical protein BC941DRAFT_408281 [Chlamydoabsidia padenii]|nr:hypothetical protein BC941DRAFT_408281 [Chlamydoabsidia padenii]
MSTFTSKTAHASTSLDSMMGMFLPKPTPTSTSSSFRTTNTYANDPELYMGDDCDADYAQALMQSGLFSSSQDNNNNDDSALERLRLMLAHLDPSTKGKSKAFY